MLDMSNMKDLNIKGVIVASHLWGMPHQGLTWKKILGALLSPLFGYPHLSWMRRYESLIFG
jgi:hypothetical protein